MSQTTRNAPTPCPLCAALPPRQKRSNDTRCLFTNKFNLTFFPASSSAQFLLIQCRTLLTLIVKQAEVVLIHWCLSDVAWDHHNQQVMKLYCCSCTILFYLFFYALDFSLLFNFSSSDIGVPLPCGLMSRRILAHYFGGVEFNNPLAGATLLCIILILYFLHITFYI